MTLRLYDAQGAVVQERVTPPCSGYCPVDNWLPGEPVEDRHGLVLPSGLNPGTYALRLSVYQPRRAQTLPTRDEQIPGGNGGKPGNGAGPCGVGAGGAPASGTPASRGGTFAAGG